MRNKLLPLLSLILLAMPVLLSCSDEETYADKRDRENKQIKGFLTSGVYILDADAQDTLLYAPGNIHVISESQFYAQDSTTSVEKNEYVYFNRTGLYMQIVDKGTGEKIKSGETLNIITRYTEYNIAVDSIQSSNTITSYAMTPDVMVCTNTTGTFSATFTQGAMKTTYSSAAVPAGWLTPLTYINLARLDSPTASLAHVRIIVPSSQGHSNASANVYPCFYDITYQRGR